MSVKIAIVDDSPSICQILRTFFESKTDWQVCGEAENGAAAIQLVQRLRPDLLVLDLSMPVMNGLDAARRIAAISPSTRIVLFTGNRIPSERELRIIELVAQGLKNTEVAEAIGTTEHVVKNYLRNIYDKLGLWNRVELALWHEARTRRQGMTN